MSISSDSSVEGSSTTPQSPERPAVGLHARKRSRTVQQETPFEIQIYNVVSFCCSPADTEPEMSDAASTETQPDSQDIPSIIAALNSLALKGKEEKEKLVEDIAKSKASIQEIKAARPPGVTTQATTQANEEVLNKLYRLCHSHQQHLRNMKKTYARHEGTRKNLSPRRACDLDRSLKEYSAKMGKIAALVKETEDKIEEEERKSSEETPQPSDEMLQELGQHLKRLETQERELSRNLAYYHNLRRFASLEPQGMELLLWKLKLENVSILEMVEEVKKAFETRSMSQENQVI
ncbi:hypothetical protein FLONG3_243 [Fusarium longipes]|uniref:Uncharacterized protein n=1 Tax=Fusarium longipes TaxID=694270 RepID=A0A395TAE7_9HYPO|nr:hypothetical protein FLONG3_243 [Fusarium longipes]